MQFDGDSPAADGRGGHAIARCTAAQTADRATPSLDAESIRKDNPMISRATIAAAARVIEYAAARPIVLSAGLMPPSKELAQGPETATMAALVGLLRKAGQS
jgi:hypothetical protein